MNKQEHCVLKLPLQNLQSSLEIKQTDGKIHVFDPLRKKYLVMQPEEMVRQLIIQYLNKYHHYPYARMAAERALEINGKMKRFDLIVFDRQAKPWLLVECKSFEIQLNDKAALQAAEYNHLLNCPYLMLSNGIDSFVCRIDFENKTTTFLNELPTLE
jgi:hypothetical protein